MTNMNSILNHCVKRIAPIPEVFKLLEEIWGPLPGHPQPKPKSKP